MTGNHTNNRKLSKALLPIIPVIFVVLGYSTMTAYANLVGFSASNLKVNLEKNSDNGYSLVVIFKDAQASDEPCSELRENFRGKLSISYASNAEAYLTAKQNILSSGKTYDYTEEMTRPLTCIGTNGIDMASSSTVPYDEVDFDKKWLNAEPSAKRVRINSLVFNLKLDRATHSATLSGNGLVQTLPEDL